MVKHSGTHNSTGSNKSSSSESSRVLVWDPESRKSRTSRLEADDETFNIGRFQRWVDVDLKGRPKTNEVKTHVASVPVPIHIMVQRVFGNYKMMVVRQQGA